MPRKKGEERSKKTVIEDFTILKKVGEGSYSEVFSAVERHSGMVCALKKIDKKSIK